MSYEPYLTLWYKLLVHHVLASRVEKSCVAREHPAIAEDTYAEILQRNPFELPEHKLLYTRLHAIRAHMDDNKHALDEEDEEEDGEEDKDDEVDAVQGVQVVQDDAKDVQDDVQDDQGSQGEPAPMEVDASDTQHTYTNTSASQALTASTLPSSPGSPHRLAPVSPSVLRTPGRPGSTYRAPLLQSSPIPSSPTPAGNASPARRKAEDDDDDFALASPSKKKT